jgi:mersacidin/lichenicidin family type 2 lantibiotic
VAHFGFVNPNAATSTKTTRKEEQMQTMEIVRAWKDEEYRDTLTLEQRALLPEHPAGVIEFEQPERDDETGFGPKGFGCKFSKYTHKVCRQ